MNDQQLILKYLSHLSQIETLVPSTIDFNERVLTKWLNFLQENNKGFKSAIPSDFVDWLSQRREEVKDSTIQKELCAFRKFHFFLYQFGFVGNNPAKSLPPMICNRPDEKSFLSVEECFTILKSIDTSTDIALRDYTLIALLWSTGLRTGECSNLQWRDINLLDATLLVRRGKGRKQRQIFLNDNLIEKLTFYQQNFNPQNDEYVFFTMSQKNSSAHSKLNTGDLSDAVQRRAKNAGIEQNVTAMTFRHTFATHMFEAQVEVDDIKEMLGHELDTETCIYIHVSLDSARKLLNAHQANPFFKGYRK